jgi:hypothetical protein
MPVWKLFSTRLPVSERTASEVDPYEGMPELMSLSDSEADEDEAFLM